ncbi:cytochrome b561 and DOMON domain-containing protein At5g47530-like [Malania oleifera]|uniref:cytochrome b561 and DOMON domain-containing protein At5g47530-like n=1 Tax=Malania oleifera TaxID=397392 RepID=UPI0025AEAA2E|nr:cytochrome b561 and DOMON domain-containing protein At5g47530-like [Malania oleifera]
MHKTHTFLRRISHSIQLPHLLPSLPFSSPLPSWTLNSINISLPLSVSSSIQAAPLFPILPLSESIPHKTQISITHLLPHSNLSILPAIAMEKPITAFLFSSIFALLLFSPASAQTCLSHTFSNNRLFSSCNDLPYLNCFLHWTLQSSNNTVNLAFRCPGAGTTQWIAWAINPSSQGMVGAQSLVAYVNSSGAAHAYTSSVTGYATQLQQSTLSFAVPSIAAEYTSSSGDLTIFATVQLSTGAATTVNQVWQKGPLSGNSPASHPTSGDNVRTTGTLDLASGTATGGGAVIPRLHRKNAHGIVNAVGWGILMPIGAMTARYMKVFKSADPAWFYLHVACQCSAYILGVAGWGTGMKLGSDSSGVQYNPHRNIGIALFCLGTLQVFALLLRPKKDHKYRLYWNIYHHSVGYSVIILSVINIYKGFDILDPEKKWKRAYTGIIIALGAIAAVLEAFTWFVVLQRKRADSNKAPSRGANGGVNGYSTSRSTGQDV